MPKLNQKGSFIIYFTLSFALLATFVGFALDFGRAYLQRARISRLVDSAALAAAKVLKGQAAYESAATRAACDSMLMNGAYVEMTGIGKCAATDGANLTVSVNFVDRVVGGGAPIKFVQVQGDQPVATTFLRFLGFLTPGDYSTIDVSVLAEAGPERPVDLMLVVDRSGSMGERDGTGRTKLAALKCALTGLGCGGTGFLGQNFSSDDRVGMTSFGKRGCGTAGGGEFTGNICTPNRAMGSTISSIESAINGLPLSGTTNTMEGLRTARAEMAKALNDPTRAATRKVVLLVTDGQPTALRFDSIEACQNNPLLPGRLPGSNWAWKDSNGCYFVKRGGSRNVAESDGLTRYYLSTSTDQAFTTGGSPSPLYLNQMAAVRNAARDEANNIRNLGGGNDVLIFAIAIGEPTNPDATARLDANARCLLAQIANDKDLIENSSTDPATGSCKAVYAVNDGDNHSDLKAPTPLGTPPTFNTAQLKGKVFTVDLNGDVQSQLQFIFNEIANLLKLRLTV